MQHGKCVKWQLMVTMNRSLKVNCTNYLRNNFSKMPLLFAIRKVDDGGDVSPTNITSGPPKRRKGCSPSCCWTERWRWESLGVHLENIGEYHWFVFQKPSGSKYYSDFLAANPDIDEIDFKLLRNKVRNLKVLYFRTRNLTDPDIEALQSTR